MKLCVIIAAVCVTVFSVNPGVKITGTPAFIEYAKKVGIRALNANIKNIIIPNVKGEPIFLSKPPEVEGVPASLASFMSYELSNIKIVNFNALNSQTTIALHAPNKATGKVNEISSGIDLDYTVWIGIGCPSGPFCVSHSGSAQATVSETTLSQEVQVTQSNGRPQIVPGTCDMTIGKLIIHFHGNIIDEILNILRGAIEAVVKGQVPPIVCKTVGSVIEDQANTLLAQIPISIDLQNGFFMDYSLTADPSVFQTNNIEVDMLARLWYTGHHDDAGIPSAGSIGAVTAAEAAKMVCLKLDAQEVLGSAAYAAMAAKILWQNVDGGLMKQFGQDPSLLKCDCGGRQCVGTFIPEIQSNCSGNGVVTFTLMETAMPTAVVTEKGAHISLAGHMDVQGNENGVVTPLFSVHVTVGAFINNSLHFEGWKIIGAIEVRAATLTLKSSNVGHIDEQSLEQLWQIAVLALVNGELNEVTQAGIELPTIPYLDIVDPELAFGNRTLSVCMDVNYTGPVTNPTN